MQSLGVQCRGIFIEKNKKWYEQLKQNLQPYDGYCEPSLGDFKTYWNRIYDLTKTHTVFVYIDPFGIEDLLFSDLSKLLAAIQAGGSVELLVNWNCIGFLRWGLQCLKGEAATTQVFSTIDVQYAEDGHSTITSKETLDLIANGNYWQSILNGGDTVDLKRCESEMAAQYLSQFDDSLLKGNCPIVPRYGLIPKYHMMFVTGNYDGFELMNDTMAKARSKSLHDEFIRDLLFDMTPDEVRRDLDLLPARIHSLISDNPGQLFKPDIKRKLIGQLGMFAKYEDKVITQTLRKLRNDKAVSPNIGRAILGVRYQAVNNG